MGDVGHGLVGERECNMLGNYSKQPRPPDEKCKASTDADQLLMQQLSPAGLTLTYYLP